MHCIHEARAAALEIPRRECALSCNREGCCCYDQYGNADMVLGQRPWLLLHNYVQAAMSNNSNEEHAAQQVRVAASNAFMHSSVTVARDSIQAATCMMPT